MAVTLARVAGSLNVEGKLRSECWDVTFDTSYVSGGMSISAANIGANQIFGARHIGGNAAAGVLLYAWDTTNNKLLALFPTGGGSTTSLADPTATIPAGATPVLSSSAQPANTLASGQAKEVGATADLHTITVRLQFIYI